MAIIFSEDINDNRGEDLSKRVDTIYDYIAYMKEQLEFWARNRTRELSDTNAKMNANTASIADLTSSVEDLDERVTELEGGE